MAGVIDLTRDRGPSVQESTANINKVLDLLGQREKIRQDSQRINDFVSETIRLTGEGLEPDIAAQQAAVNITKKDPTFDPGIAGGFQRFASGLISGPSTTLTGPIAQTLLDQPTGINKEKVRAQIEASKALAQSRTSIDITVGGEFTEGQKQRVKLVKIIEDDESENQLRSAEARQKLSELPKEDLLDFSDVDPKQAAKEFSGVMKGLKDLRERSATNKLDKRFGKEAFDAGLKEAVALGLNDGIDPDTIKVEFEKWWDKQFAAEKGQKFQKFEDQATFGDDTALPEPTTQEEFDAIPSGSQFKDTDGKVKVKK